MLSLSQLRERHMATITDITKLRPDLEGLSDAELERGKTEYDMEIARRAHKKKQAQVAGIVDESNAAIDAIVEGLRILEKHNLLSDEAKLFYSSATGAFMPHLKHKRITADRVIVRSAEKPVKKTRRKKAG
jgi:FlaA1/EpsC-like NDP-sugar epimerase